MEAWDFVAVRKAREPPLAAVVRSQSPASGAFSLGLIFKNRAWQ